MKPSKREIWEDVMKATGHQVHLLSDYLGDAHDLAILKETLRQSPDEFGDKPVIQSFQGFIDKRGKELRGQAKFLGKRIFSEKPKQIQKRYNYYWDTWQSSDAMLGLS